MTDVMAGLASGATIRDGSAGEAGTGIGAGGRSDAGAESRTASETSGGGWSGASSP